MKFYRCVGCGGETRPQWDRAPKHPRLRRQWEAEREEIPTVCENCNGGIDNGGVAVVHEDDQLVAYYFRLKPGCGEPPGWRFYLHTHTPERLPENITWLYAKLVEQGNMGVQNRCELLGHEETRVADPDRHGFVVTGCARCNLISRDWDTSRGVRIWFRQADVVAERERQATKRREWLETASDRMEQFIREGRFSGNGAVFTSLEILVSEANKAGCEPAEVLARTYPETESHQRLARWVKDKTGCTVRFWFSGGDESETEGPHFDDPNDSSGQCEMPDRRLWDCLKGKRWEQGHYQRWFNDDGFSTANESFVS